MKTYFSPSSTVTLSILVGCAQGHGYCSKPQATFKPGEVYTNYVGITSASINKGFDGGVYNHEPVNNAQQFTEHWGRHRLLVAARDARLCRARLRQLR